MHRTNVPMAQDAKHFGLVLHCLPCITGKVLFSLVRNTDKYVISFKTTRCKKAGGIFASVHHSSSCPHLDTQNYERPVWWGNLFGRTLSIGVWI